MLEDLSAHVLDISENSVMAGATEIEIGVDEDCVSDRLIFFVEDNGKGMDAEFLRQVADPFVTTRTTRRVGMGIPFLKQSAELTGGGLEIVSEPGKGTKITAQFGYSSVDRPPMGDMAATMMTLIMGAPEIHWKYTHKTPNGVFTLDSDEIIEALDGDWQMLRSPEVGLWLREHISEGLAEIGPNRVE